MRTTVSTILIFLFASPVFAQTIPSKEIQIRTALMAAPEEKRAGAMIYGYDAKGEWLVLRKGTNEMVCLADDPKSPGFNTSCYHSDLEPFMERGRKLKIEGKTAQQIFDIQEAEAKSGKLRMPKSGATLFSLAADAADYNASTGEVKNSYLRYVVYIPWGTPETTGLPLKAYAPGMPWIMDPGTHRAHIMINPPRD